MNLGSDVKKNHRLESSSSLIRSRIHTLKANLKLYAFNEVALLLVV
jgi:hypothetical protein